MELQFEFADALAGGTGSGGEQTQSNTDSTDEWARSTFSAKWNPFF